MIDARTAPFAATLLRVALGFLFLAHAGLKIFVFTPAGTAKFFGNLGLPPALAYLMIALEVIGGLALVLGIYSRIAALVLVPGMIGAIVTVHGSAGFFFDNPHGGWEYPAFWIVGLLCVALLGDGAFAMLPTTFKTDRAHNATGQVRI
ncbi:DoxX family protein [Lichenifustis flavocetrariae]|uniref:DoxX family protein n=1 Tax=Lichenifustis flavocetrariae TaxID=2949735 RepID=A0AA42CMW5_9HYPH|nr:DoxX family protein [Lichenifustis flavocetrariae]MCW6513129.1 DoxX family protein [Lichenifustis flavocetrariae]